MKTAAKIVLDSLSPAGARITTLQLVYPRFIHSEFLTHREFSRNSSSSRAIPVAKMIAMVRNHPATPVHWGANQPGMQARAELEGESLEAAQHLWTFAAMRAADTAEKMEALGLHKQVANRILEPFQWMQTIVTATATKWPNFFKLRLHPDADPNFYALALAMDEALSTSVPVPRELHAPYCDELVPGLEYIDNICLISAARCARVSYLNHDGSNPDRDKDLALAKMLKDSGHASPFEHVAFADEYAFGTNANFRGWKSFRFTLNI